MESCHSSPHTTIQSRDLLLPACSLPTSCHHPFQSPGDRHVVVDTHKASPFEIHFHDRLQPPQSPVQSAQRNDHGWRSYLFSARFTSRFRTAARERNTLWQPVTQKLPFVHLAPDPRSRKNCMCHFMINALSSRKNRLLG